MGKVRQWPGALDSQQGVWVLPGGNGKLVECILSKGGGDEDGISGRHDRH